MKNQSAECYSGDKAQAFSWLARVFWDVPDQEMLKDFDPEWFSFAGDNVSEGVLTTLKNAQELDEEGIKELRVDYTSLFCGFNPNDPFPYESVFRGEERRLMRPERDDVLYFYKDNGFLAKSQNGNEPEDHLAFELEFVAFLLNEEMVSEDAQRVSNIRKQFLDEHLLNWVESFSASVEQSASTSFYKSLVLLLVASIHTV